jgi:hypothetical protein
MGEFSTERLAPSPRVVEPKAQQGQRDLSRPPRRKPLPTASSNEAEPETPDTDVPRHHLDRLA